jgi:mannose-6-phosphate isomerase-like protein (cupin superfamily)
MITIDLTAEVSKLKMLHSRTPEMTSAQRAGSSTRLATYRDSGVWASKSAGKGAWERHPDGDEYVHVLDGAGTLEIVSDDDARPQSITVRAGMLAIVPRGAWHRFDYPEGLTMITLTPGQSEFVRADVDDPRAVTPER